MLCEVANVKTYDCQQAAQSCSPLHCWAKTHYNKICYYGHWIYCYRRERVKMYHKTGWNDCKQVWFLHFDAYVCGCFGCAIIPNLDRHSRFSSERFLSSNQKIYVEQVGASMNPSLSQASSWTWIITNFHHQLITITRFPTAPKCVKISQHPNLDWSNSDIVCANISVFWQLTWQLLSICDDQRTELMPKHDQQANDHRGSIEHFRGCQGKLKTWEA